MGIKTCKEWLDFCGRRFGWTLKFRELLSDATNSGATALLGDYANALLNVLSAVLGEMPAEMRYIIKKIQPYRKRPNIRIRTF